MDKNDQECEATTYMPDGKDYSNQFIIDTDNRKGISYVQCKIKSKVSVYDMNIMQFLKNKNLFINICKLKSSKEACIGFLSGRHPNTTLKSDLCEDIDRYLQEINLTSK